MKLSRLINKLEQRHDYKNIAQPEQFLLSLKELSEIKGNDNFKNNVALDLKHIIKSRDPENISRHILLTGKTNRLDIKIIIGEILNSLYFTEWRELKIINREDLVDLYVGWSDYKTRKILEENIGKIILLDEFHLIMPSQYDHHGQDVLVSIINFILNHSNDTVFIFSGDKEILDQNIFNTFQGLKSRIWFKY